MVTILGDRLQEGKPALGYSPKLDRYGVTLFCLLVIKHKLEKYNCGMIITKFCLVVKGFSVHNVSF